MFRASIYKPYGVAVATNGCPRAVQNIKVNEKSVDFDVVGIEVWVGVVGSGGWFCRRVAIRYIYCFCMVMNRGCC